MSETERLKKVVEENESNSRFHNFAECLCESYQREELVKAVEDAWVAYYVAYDARDDAEDAYDAAYDAREAACSLLGVYDKENAK